MMKDSTKWARVENPYSTTFDGLFQGIDHANPKDLTTRTPLELFASTAPKDRHNFFAKHKQFLVRESHSAATDTGGVEAENDTAPPVFSATREETAAFDAPAASPSTSAAASTPAATPTTLAAQAASAAPAAIAATAAPDALIAPAAFIAPVALGAPAAPAAKKSPRNASTAVIDNDAATREVAPAGANAAASTHASTHDIAADTVANAAIIPLANQGQDPANNGTAAAVLAAENTAVDKRTGPGRIPKTVTTRANNNKPTK